MMDQTLFFRLFANCIVVDGPKRSVICDLQNSKIKFIPNLLSEILKVMETKNIRDTKLFFDSEQDDGIDLYIDKLVQEDMGFVTDHPEAFVNLDMKWDMPSVVTNAIVDSDSDSSHDFSDIIRQLEKLYCQTIQFRYNHSVTLDAISSHLHATLDSTLRGIEIVCPYIADASEELITRFWSANGRVKSFLFYNAPFAKSEELYYGLYLNFVTDDFIPSQRCGVISNNHFASNIPHFTEAQKHNTCLNRKISIDTRGNIRNCPSLPVSYGNIRETSLKEVLNNAAFKAPWDIDKSQIEVCKDCEFRYICSDCRASVNQQKNADGLYPKPAKCTYNPFEAIWEN